MGFFTAAGACLFLGFAALGLMLYVRRRNKQRRLAAWYMDEEAQRRFAENLRNDDFYCILRNDGTCSSGYIERPPAE